MVPRVPSTAAAPVNRSMSRSIVVCFRMPRWYAGQLAPSMQRASWTCIAGGPRREAVRSGRGGRLARRSGRDGHAALTRLRVEAGLGRGVAEADEQALREREVRPADEVAVVLNEGVERAV